MIGPRLGADTQDVIRAVREGRVDRRGRRASSPAVTASSRASSCSTLQTDDDDRAAPRSSSGVGVVVLNVDVTPELEIEGQARDLVRMIQQARRDRDLAVTDRIDLRIRGDERWALVVRTHEQFIADRDAGRRRWRSTTRAPTRPRSRSTSPTESSSPISTEDLVQIRTKSSVETGRGRRYGTGGGCSAAAV